MLSSPALEAIYAPRTAKVFLELLTITHADLASTIRLVNDRVDIVSRSNTYTAFPFECRLVPDRDGELPQAEISCDNVSRTLIQQIRTLEAPPQISVEVILADTPDTIEMGPYEFTVTQAVYDAATITLSLAFENILAEPYPSGIFSPANFAGLFQAVAS